MAKSKKKKQKKRVMGQMSLKQIQKLLCENENVGCAVGWVDVYIVKAIFRLPKKVQQFVFRNCYFIPANGCLGKCAKVRKQFPYIIILVNRSETTVAHEIAHAYLDHDEEYQVLQLIEKWGFCNSETIPKKDTM